MKKNKGFGSVGILLAVVAVLVVGTGAYYLDEKSSTDNMDGYEQEEKKDMDIPVQDSLKVQAQLYTNTGLGFSFNPLNFGSVKTFENSPIVMPGDKGSSIRGYLSFQNPVFYFASMTPSYSAPRGRDCGEVPNLEGYNYAVAQYGEISNDKGVRYVYGNVTSDEMTGPHQIALFKLKKGQFPVLGFCAIGMSELDFKSVINTVSL